jgi:hypothetical protein
MADFHPKRRQDGIRVEEFQGEVLVYDLERHSAHCLNGVAVAVWRLADGRSSVDQIAHRIANEYGGDRDEALVWRALEELAGASLLDTPLPSAAVDTDRRRLVGQLGWAAAIPLVLSIAVPTPAFAQSGPTGPQG